MNDRRAFEAAIAAAPQDEAPKKVFADWLDERGESDEAALYRGWTADRPPPFGLDDYGWREAFGYAGEPDTCAEAPDVKPAAPGMDVATSPFRLRDVAEVIAVREGENDERNWFCVGRLFDGRWFALDAGCDYTGWD